MEFVLSKWFSNKHLKEHPMLTKGVIKLQNKNDVTDLTFCRVYTAPRDLVAPSVSRGLSQGGAADPGPVRTRGFHLLVQKHNLTSCQFHNKDGSISFDVICPIIH